MKTSEISSYICDKNPRIFVGNQVAFLPLVPILGSRTWQEVGWVSFQLIRMADPAYAGSSACFAHFNPRLGAFAFLSPSYAAESGDWEPIEFDGYGELRTWWEVVG